MSVLKPDLGASSALVMIGLSILLSQPLVAELEVSPYTVIRPAPPELCALLDDPKLRAMMDGLFYNLVWSCGRQKEFLGHWPEAGLSEPSPGVARKQVVMRVNHILNESPPSATQSETTLAEDATSGILCAAFNDSWELLNGRGFTGFARSLDNGASWQDFGGVGATSWGDPSMAWRQADGLFFLATLESGGGLSIWRTTDGCQSFNLLKRVTIQQADDKEFLTIDNHPSSPGYGNMYLVWTRFESTPSIYFSRSRWVDGGLFWSAPVRLGRAGGPGLVQGAWPAVAPNGDVYVAWMSTTDFPRGELSIQIVRSTDAGANWMLQTPPVSGVPIPLDDDATDLCGVPSLQGNIRILPSPQLAIDDAGRLHVVYSKRPEDGKGGDVIDVYYRRSTDGAQTWGPEIRLNDDTTENDQYHPTISVSGNTVQASWYDRRWDPENQKFNAFKRLSTDGGTTWFPNIQLSSVQSDIVLDPILAPCYHGDYDQSLIADDRTQVALWSDDRTGDPDVYAGTGQCFGGTLNGPWSTPTTAPLPVAGTVTGAPIDPRTLYTLSGQAFPNGQISGTLTGTGSDYTPMLFLGQWQTAAPQGTVPQGGGWTAQLQSATVPGLVIGTMYATWNPPGSGLVTSSWFQGSWTVCLP